MFISCGQDEPLRSPQTAYFICLIGIYFVSFFYEHPVINLLFMQETLTLTVYEITFNLKIKVWEPEGSLNFFVNSYSGLLIAFQDIKN